MIYNEPPNNFQPRFEIVSCYLEHNGKFVLLHRPDNKSQPNKWGVAAGKVEAGEGIEDAMIREIREETGIITTKGDLEYFTTLYVRSEEYDLTYHMFHMAFLEPPKISINPDEHINYLWASPEEALTLDLVHDLDECIKLYYKETVI